MDRSHQHLTDPAAATLTARVNLTRAELIDQRLENFEAAADLVAYEARGDRWVPRHDRQSCPPARRRQTDPTTCGALESAVASATQLFCRWARERRLLGLNNILTVVAR